MKKIFQIIAMLICGAVFSQTTRFVYELKYRTDSTSSKYENEEVILELNGNDVQFYEKQALRIDSLNAANPNGVSNYPFVLNKLRRKIGEKSNINYNLLGQQYWAYKSDDPISWTLQNETKMVDKWKAQKATADFAGRKWIAWFVSELPISEGPYKFNGLPGLVVEVGDTQENYNFKLLKIEKPKTTNPKVVETLFKNAPLTIPYAKYREMQMNYYNDPYHDFRLMKEGTWKIGMNGNEITTKEGLNDVTKSLQADMRRNNSPLELDKALKIK